MEDGVMVLTDANFDEEVAKNPLMFVMFYARRCPHCQRLAPDFEAAAARLAQHDPPIVLAKIDARKEKIIPERCGVGSWPTLFFFKNGVMSETEYSGERTEEALAEWAIKKSGPPSTPVTCDALKDLVADEKNKFILAFFGAEDHHLYTEAHVPYANLDDPIKFVHADLSCQENHGLRGASKIVLFRRFEVKMMTYTPLPYSEIITNKAGHNEKDALIQFIKPLLVQTVFEFKKE